MVGCSEETGSAAVETLPALVRLSDIDVTMHVIDVMRRRYSPSNGVDPDEDRDYFGGQIWSVTASSSWQTGVSSRGASHIEYGTLLAAVSEKRISSQRSRT